MSKKLIMLALLLFLPCLMLLSDSRELVSGTWSDSVYIIENDITLASGDTLIIENGVNIFFDGEYEFQVSGSLKVLGTEEAPVIFQSMDTYSYWKGIRFLENNANYDSSYVNFAEIKYAMNEDGGGINIDHYDEITIENSRISNCHAVNGGGMYLYYAAIEFKNSVIENNSAENIAGGIFILNSHITMENVSVNNNYSASEAGGIYIKSCRPNLLNCEISNNIADEFGGGILTRNLYMGAIIQDCVIRDNYAGLRGGGFYSDAGWAYLYASVLENNESYLGGGSYMVNANVDFENCLIIDNSANFGGGVYLSSSGSSFVNCLINFNSAEFGGGIYSISASNHIIYNSNILWNQAVYNGGGYYTMGDDYAYLVNSIFYYNSTDVLGENQICINSPIRHTYMLNCVIQDGLNGISGHTELLIPPYYVNNLEETPGFIDIFDDFQLLETSPCIDAGTIVQLENFEVPDYDLAGNPRIYGDSIDIGAYEWQGVDAEDDTVMKINQTRISNYPNPFNPDTTIRLELAEAGRIELSIYNIKGQKVRNLLDAHTEPGIFTCNWNGRDDNGRPVSSGQYFIKLKQNDEVTVEKMMMVK